MLLQRGQKLPGSSPVPGPPCAWCSSVQNLTGQVDTHPCSADSAPSRAQPRPHGSCGPLLYTLPSACLLPLSGGLPGISHRLFHIGPRPPRKQITGFSFKPIPSDFSMWVWTPPLRLTVVGIQVKKEEIIWPGLHGSGKTWCFALLLSIGPQWGAPASP